MNENTRNFMVGLFVWASLSVLGLLMVWFGETPSWLPSSEWELRITDVSELSGVGEGSSVKLNGVEIGRVSDLEFENVQRPGQGVVIIARIQKEYSIPEGAMAKVYGATFGLGSGHIDIVVPPDSTLEPLDKEFAQIRGEMRSVIGEMISKELVNSVERTITHMGDLSAAAAPVATNLALLIEQRNIASTRKPGGKDPNLSTVIERIDRLIANVNAVLGDENVQGDIKAVIGDLNLASGELREMMALWQRESQRISDNANAGIDRTEENLERSFAKLNDLLDHLDDAATGLARVMHDASEGKGTIGLLARDDRLYESGVLAMERLADLIGTLQRVFGKIEEDGYINVGQLTVIGPITKKIPIGQQAKTDRSISADSSGR